jgi:hypothetical protein
LCRGSCHCALALKGYPRLPYFVVCTFTRAYYLTRAALRDCKFTYVCSVRFWACVHVVSHFVLCLIVFELCVCACMHREYRCRVRWSWTRRRCLHWSRATHCRTPSSLSPFSDSHPSQVLRLYAYILIPICVFTCIHVWVCVCVCVMCVCVSTYRGEAETSSISQALDHFAQSLTRKAR